MGHVSDWQADATDDFVPIARNGKTVGGGAIGLTSGWQEWRDSNPLAGLENESQRSETGS
jgi:hypothetical protein